jgi:hypothetical protein
MKANLSGRSAGHHRITRLTRSAALWVGATAVTCGVVSVLSVLAPGRAIVRAVTIAVLASRTVNAEIIDIAPRLQAMPAQHDAMAGSPPSTASHAAASLQLVSEDVVEQQPTEPRECRLDAGIVTACVFN